MVSTSRGIRAAQAYVQLSMRSDIDKQLFKLQRRLRNFGASIGRLGAGLAGGGLVLGAPFVDAINKASDAEESLNKFRAVFGSLSADAEEFANGLAKAVNRSSLDILEGLTTFQSFFVGLGFQGNDASKLSKELQGLALDFASFNNISDDEAIQRFISALSGSSEVLDRFGINIKQAAIEQQLLSQGVTKAFSAVTEQEKAMARLAIIAKSLGDQGAIGDAAKTSGSFANQLKGLQAAIDDTRRAIGDVLLPVATKMVAKFIEVVRVIQSFVKDNAGVIKVVAGVAAAMVAAGTALTLLGGGAILASLAVTGLATVFGIVTAAISGLFSAIVFLLSPVAVVTALWQGLLVVFAAITSPLGLVIVAVTALATAWLKFGDGFKTLNKIKSDLVSFKDTALDVFKSIVQALNAGDIGAAWEVGVAGLEVVWQTGLTSMITSWTGWKSSVLNLADDAFTGVGILYNKLVSTINSGLIESKATGIIAEMANAFKGRSPLDGVENFFALFTKGLELTRAKTEDERKRIEEEIRQLRGGDNSPAIQAGNKALDEQRNAQKAIQDKLAKDQLAVEDELAARQKARLDARNKGNEADVAAAQKKLDDAEARLQEAQRRAAAASKEAKKTTADKLAAGAAAGAAGGNITSGGFSGRLAALQVGNLALQERIAAATEATEKHTQIAANRVGGFL